LLRLLLIEDHAAFRSALALLLDLRPGMKVVAQCGSLAGCRALGGLLQTVDVALLDLFLPDGDGTASSRSCGGPTPRSGCWY
jgi:DNA-binding NarL/FixJ family response regulator